MRSRILVTSLCIVAALAFADTAFAKKKRAKMKHWQRYDATLICDVADTTVVVFNASKVQVPVVVRLADAGGDTQEVQYVPAEGISSFDCTSTGVTGTGVLSFESPIALHATAAYEDGGQLIQIETLPAKNQSGKHFPSDDSDTGDSDSASGDPTPM